MFWDWALLELLVESGLRIEEARRTSPWPALILMHPSPMGRPRARSFPVFSFALCPHLPAAQHPRSFSASLEIFLVGHMLHPINNFTVEFFLNGDVSHGRGRSGTMPVLFTGGEPDDITRMDVLDGVAFQLHPPRSRSHDQSLTKGMSVPRCACAWLKRDARAGYERGFRRLKQWIDAYGPVTNRQAPCRMPAFQLG
jgi:hypothetical protein